MLVGLRLLGVSMPPLPGEGCPLPEPASPPTAVARPAAPDPLPQLQAHGMPAAPDPVLPSAPGKVEQAPPAPMKLAPAAPERPPAFRPVKQEQEDEPSRLKPHTPEGGGPGPSPGLPRPVGAHTPTVALEKIGPGAVRAGEPFVYEIVLRNLGPTPAGRLVVEDELPPGTRVLRAEPAALVQDNHLAWQLDGLPPGAAQRFRVQVQSAEGGEWKGTATVLVAASCELRVEVSGPAPPPAAHHAVPVRAPAPADAVRLELRGPDSFVPQGHPLLFNLRVTNQGAVPLSGLLLHAHLPPGLEHFYGSDIELNLDPLVPGESRTEKLEVIAAQPGRHVAELSVRAAGAAPVAAQAAVTVRSDPILGIRLIGPRETWTGHEVEYRIEVTNRAPTVVPDVVVLERLPQGVTLVTVPPGVSYDGPSRTAQWRLGNLAPGQARVFAVKLQARATGPALHDIAARTGQGHEARLLTVLKFWPQRAPGERER
jgi:uncharacterized repeat protein (TIGR01451 family)